MPNLSFANIKLTKWFWPPAALLLVLLLGIIDYETGDYSLIVYYTIPVSIGSWFVGSGFGISMAVISGTVRFCADRATYANFSFINYLNVAQDTVYLLIIAIIIANLRSKLSGDKNDS